jgi:hypothetical protein
MFLSNWSAKIVNGSPAEETPRERPLYGHHGIRDALESRDDLQNTPVIVRDTTALQSLEALGVTRSHRALLLVENLEQAVRDTRASLPHVFELGEERRSTSRCENSVDEARTIAGRVFFALSGLSERERTDAITRATVAGGPLS